MAIVVRGRTNTRLSPKAQTARVCQRERGTVCGVFVRVWVCEGAGQIWTRDVFAHFQR